jgi:hypothetical protein
MKTAIFNLSSATIPSFTRGAAVAHAITAYSGLLSSKVIMAQKAVTKLYYHLTNGVDSGMPELDVLNYWRQNAVDKDKILAASEEAHRAELKAARGTWRSRCLRAVEIFAAGFIAGVVAR